MIPVSARVQECPARSSPLLVGETLSASSESLRKIRDDIDAQPAQIFSYPQWEPTTQDEAKLMAEEMNDLSTGDRERLYEEMHGVENEIEEHLDFVASKLEQFQKELDRIKDKPAYDKALQMDAEYCNQRSLRLKFLRADRFDPKKSAYRWIACFEIKSDLWGSERLVSEITLQDLDEDTLAVIKSGVIQILPCRDRVGRKVLCNYQGELKNIVANTDSVVRILYIDAPRKAIFERVFIKAYCFSLALLLSIALPFGLSRKTCHAL